MHHSIFFKLAGLGEFKTFNNYLTVLAMSGLGYFAR